MSVAEPVDLLAELFAGAGLRSYLGEEVSIAVHMLQAGALAERAGAPNQVVAAALSRVQWILVRRGGKIEMTPRGIRKLGERALVRVFERLGLAKPADWQFPHGSSGPFGEEAPGKWLSFNDACLRWLDFRRVYADTLWCDVHATKSGESAAPGLRQAA